MPGAATAEARIIESMGRKDICGHCKWGPHPEGKHPNCPRAVRNGSNAKFKIITCECPHPGCGDEIFRCLDCKNERQDELDKENWRCFDLEACHDRIQTRLLANPQYQQILEIRRSTMAKIANENAEKAAKKAATPKVGSCLHCGEPTKGGKFLPGHDAAYVSALVRASIDKPATADSNRAKAQAASESLGVKFDKSLGLAREREAKAAAAADAKAAAKTAKTAKKAVAAK